MQRVSLFVIAANDAPLTRAYVHSSLRFLPLRTRGKRLVFAALIAFAYLYSFPYFETMRHANELPRVCLTTSMVDQQSFSIDACAREHGETADMSPSGGKMYSNKAPGSSFLAVPAYFALKTVTGLFGRTPTLAEQTWAFRVSVGVIPSLLFLWLLWHFLGRFATKPQTRRLVLVTYGVGSMAFLYSTQFMAHQLSAICIGGAYVLLTRVFEEDWDRRWLWVMGFSAGCAPLVDYQAAFAGVPLAAWFLWHCIRKRWFNDVAMATVCAAVPIAALLWYHAIAFGHPLRTGYSASVAFAHYHQRGFLGMDQLRSEAFLGSLFSVDNGLLVFCPALIFVLPGIVVLWRRNLRIHALMSFSVVTIYLLFISSIIFWRGGWQVGPRYIVVMLPFMLPAIAAFFSRVEPLWWMRGVVLGLVSVGVFVYGLSTFYFPHFPEVFSNPVFDLVIRLLGEGHAPWNLGWFIGLQGWASFVPYGAILLSLLYMSGVTHLKKWKPMALGGAICVTYLFVLSKSVDVNPKSEPSYQRIVTWMPKS